MDRIDLRVRFRDQERVLRLVEVGGEWHAALLVPGKPDLLTQECPAPSPPGTYLLAMQLNDCELRIERPLGNVESIALGRLMLSGRVTAEDGWVKVPLRSIRADYHEDIGDRHGTTSLAELRAARQATAVRTAGA